MKTKIVLLALALSASTSLLTAQDAPPPSDGQRPPPHEAGPGAPGGPGGRGGFHLLPPRAQDQLNLSPEQMNQISALEAETKTKLEKILTPEQLQKMKEMRPPQRQGGPDKGGEKRGPSTQDRPQPPRHENE